MTACKRIHISAFFSRQNFIVDKVQQCTIKKFCRALHLIQAKKITKLSNLVLDFRG